VVIGLMEEGPAQGSTPTSADVESWNDQYGIQHPMLADVAGTQMGYYVSGFPTYVVIDREMVVQNADLWPFDANYVINML